MTVTGMLSLLVAVVAAVIYLVCAGASKATAAQLALYAWWSALLAFLLHADRIAKLFP